MNLSPIDKTLHALDDFCANQVVSANSERKLLRVSQSLQGPYLELVDAKEEQKKWGVVDYLKSFLEVGECSLICVIKQIEQSGILNQIHDTKKRDVVIRALNAKIEKHNSRWLKFVTISPFQVVAKKVSDIAKKTFPTESVTPGEDVEDNLSLSDKQELATLLTRIEKSTEGIVKLPELSKSKLDQLQNDHLALEQSAKARFSQKVPEKLQAQLQSLGNLLKAFQASLEVNKIYQHHYVFDKATNVIRQKGDGNCLYYSFSQGLEFLGGSRQYAARVGITPPEGDTYTKEELRALVKKYYEDHYKNDLHLQMLIKDAITQQNLSIDESITKGKDNILDALSFLIREQLNSERGSNRTFFTEIVRKLQNLKQQVPHLSNDGFMTTLNQIKQEVTAKKVFGLNREITPLVEQCALLIQQSRLKIELPCEEQAHNKASYESTLENAFRLYFEKTKEDRFWGAIPEIYALLRIFKCNVTVSRNRGGRIGRVRDEQAMQLIKNTQDYLGAIHLDFENLDHFNLYVE